MTGKKHDIFNRRPLFELFRVRSILRDLFHTIRDAQLSLAASSLAYTTILSLIPLLAVSFAIFQAFGGLEKLYSALEPFILENLTQGSGAEAIQTIRQSIQKIHAGTLGASGLVGLLFTSLSMLFSFENSVNRIWRTEAKRSFFVRITAYWFFITLGPLALAVALGVATSIQVPLGKLFPSGTGFFLILSAAFSAIYKLVPNRKVHWLPAVVGGISAAAVWNIARLTFGIYTRQFNSYEKIYGSLGAVPILILWIYIGWLVVLGGAALSAALQRRRDVG